ITHSAKGMTRIVLFVFARYIVKRWTKGMIMNMKRFLIRIWFLFKLHKSIPFMKDFFLSQEIGIFKKVVFVVLIIGYAIFHFDLITCVIVALCIVFDVSIAFILFQLMVKAAPYSLKEKYDATPPE